MSGGVDSAVAALLLKDKFALTGVTMKLWNENGSADKSIADAKKIAEALDFSHLDVDLSDEFFCE